MHLKTIQELRLRISKYEIEIKEYNSKITELNVTINKLQLEIKNHVCKSKEVEKIVEKIVYVAQDKEPARLKTTTTENKTTHIQKEEKETVEILD